MHQQRQADFFHCGKRPIAVGNVCYPRIGVGRCTGGVVFHGVYCAAFAAMQDFRWRRVIGKVERHQRREMQALRQRSEDTGLICQRHVGRHHRWFEVGHDDSAGETPRGIRQHCPQLRTVAQVKMKVVWASDR